MSEFDSVFYQTLDSLPYVPSKAIVEAGHVYSGNKPGALEIAGAVIGAKLTGLLSDMGIQVDQWLFVDDYNGLGDKDMSTSACIDMYSKVKYYPNHVIYESAMVNGADDLIRTLMTKRRARDTGKHIYVPFGSDNKIYLTKKEGKGWKYTCEVLDAALYLHKAELIGEGVLVTVLPSSQNNREQQAKSKLLLQFAGCFVPILNVFYDLNGHISVDFGY